MFEEILLPQTKKLLEELKEIDLPKATYLAGGTAIALQLGHRLSQDLDFFTTSEFNETQWEQNLSQNLNFKASQKDWQTLIGEIKEIKFSLFHYKYKLIGELLKFKNIKVASLEDLSAMKLDTIISRGKKRDFIDIYFLAQKFGLSTLFDFYEKKYGNFKERELMIKKALLYFEDADKDEMPYMLTKVKWENIKRDFVKYIR